MRDISYIIKRIIIGVGIALALMFIKGNILIGVKAQEMSSSNVGGQGVQVTSNTASSDFTISGNPWANWRLGHLYFNFGITKVAGSSTDPLLVPRAVFAKSDTSAYICNFGTASYSNSTFTGASYSVDCPMDMGWPGLTGISILYMPFSTQSYSTYNVQVNGWMTFEQNANTQVNVDTSSTNNAINQQTQNDNTNTQNIINNQNSNTQNIINNQNTNSDKEIESQKVCSTIKIDKNSILKTGFYLDNNGSETSVSSNQPRYWGITDFIDISRTTDIKNLVNAPINANYRFCFYDNSKSVISCFSRGTYDSSVVTVPNNSKYVRFTIDTSSNKPQFEFEQCKNGNQAIADSQQEINNTLNNDNVDGASSEASDFFNDFQSDSHGLSGIITAPLRLINALTTAQCSPLQFQLPFVHDQVTLPCMRGIYEQHFGVFFSLYQLITTGLICYSTLINLYSKIHNLQNPKNDRIEVLNL